IGVSAFGCSTEGLKENYTRDEEANLKFVAQDNFFLPKEIKVEVNDTILTKDVDYQYVVDGDYLNADFKIKVTDDVEVTISAYDITIPLTFTSNKDNASFGIYHLAVAAPSNESIDFKYIIKDKDGKIKDEKEITLTDANVGPQLLCDKTLNQGDTIQLCGDNPNGFNQMIFDKDGNPQKVIETSFYTGDSDDFTVSGNIMSLLSKDSFTSLTSVPGTGCFNFLFASDPDSLETSTKYHCNITDASGLYIPYTAKLSHAGLFAYSKTLVKAPIVLPASLSSWCYYSMFSYCSVLTNPPSLSALSLAQYCYASMFEGCDSLKNAPELSAKRLANNCYSYMFAKCNALTTSPAIKAENLAIQCCEYMFCDCENLITAPNLPVTQLVNYCYSRMFSGCKKLTTVFDLPATQLKYGCYQQMFASCESLVKSPAIKAETLDTDCCESMFTGCKALKEPPELLATTLKKGCYDNMFYFCESLVVTKKGADEKMFFKCPSIEESDYPVNMMFWGTKGDYSNEDPKEGDCCFYS
ncbi:MAG: leucine-rich repeat protein, partial [Bacilli bacterium]|nr:leucine-rich repeat protein [Bacilli bacterium]